jgi:hypothetical protein
MLWFAPSDHSCVASAGICARNADAGALDELIAFTGRDLQQQDWR